MTRRRYLAALMCAIMALSLLASLGYTTHMAAHPHCCVDETCPVCRFIARVEGALRGFAMLLVWLATGGFAVAALTRRLACEGTILPALETPVDRMVRMND